jgi:predicted DNA-binding transcriptional regulator AlpA
MPPNNTTANGHAVNPIPADPPTVEGPAQQQPAGADLAGVLHELVRELRRQGVEPELLTARQAAALCSLSPASWHRLHSAGRCPAPVRLSGSVRWRRAELLAWIAANCPPRREWAALRQSAGGGH